MGGYRGMSEYWNEYGTTIYIHPPLKWTIHDGSSDVVMLLMLKMDR